MQQSASTISAPASVSPRVAVQSVSGVVTPGPRVPSPSPAPAGDRTAADLRSRLSAARWVDDAVLCADLLRWQVDIGLDAVGAAKELGLPHVGADALRRIAAGFRPIGAKGLWPELAAARAGACGVDLSQLARDIHDRVARGLPLDATRVSVERLVADAGSMRRAGQKLACAAGEPGGVNYWEGMVRQIRATARAATTTAPATAADAQGSLDVLAKRVAAELGKPGKKNNTRTIETARMLADTMCERSETYVRLGKTLAGREGCKENAWQMRIVAYMRQFPDLFARVLKAPASTPAPAPSLTATPAETKTVKRVTQVQVAASAPAPAATADSLQGVALACRPTMLVSGRLRVVVRATLEIGPESPLWADAVAAMNAEPVA